jgi:excisionase family DNA binding protein
MKERIQVSESMLDVIAGMLSPTNPELTKEDVRSLFSEENSKTTDCNTQLFTRREVAERLKVSLPTIARWLAEGTLKKIKIGGSVRIAESEIQRHLQQAA